MSKACPEKCGLLLESGHKGFKMSAREPLCTWWFDVGMVQISHRLAMNTHQGRCEWRFWLGHCIRIIQECLQTRSRDELTRHNTSCLLFSLFFWKLFFLYLRFFPFFLAIPAFGTTYLGWHVRLFLKQTSIQSLHLVASKVWIQLIKIKVYIFPPYFTHKIKTLFWTPSKMGVLKYLTFVSQINVMRQKIKHKNCTKMIKFILKIPVIKWCKEYINLILFYVTDHQSN